MTRPDAPGAGHEDTVTQAADVDRIRRRWRLHQQFVTRPAIRRALDVKAGAPAVTYDRTDGIDYAAMGFTLGIPERTAAGIALREAA